MNAWWIAYVIGLIPTGVLLAVAHEAARHGGRGFPYHKAAAIFLLWPLFASHRLCLWMSMWDDRRTAGQRRRRMIPVKLSELSPDEIQSDEEEADEPVRQ